MQLTARAGALLLCAMFAAACGSGDGVRYDDSPADDSAAPAYTIQISVADSVGKVGALQLEILHLGRSGGFIGRGDQVACEPSVDAIVAANYPGENILKIGMISLQGLTTPDSIIECGFRTYEELDENSFSVSVTDASSPEGDALDPPPHVIVSAVTPR